MISCTILTKNSEKYLGKVLSSLTQLQEVAILDSGSLDKTLEIAESFPNVTIHKHEFLGFGKSHNLITSLAKYDWILSIDSDEVLTPELINEIEKLPLDDKCCYSIQRDNFYRGKLIKCAGWYPDRVVRLYNRKITRFDEVLVHEAVIKDGLKVVPLSSPLNHYPYDKSEDFIKKMDLYTKLFAEMHKGKKSSSFFKALTHGSFAFFKSYFLKKGIFYGAEGFEISFYNAITSYYKYLRLRDINSK